MSEQPRKGSDSGQPENDQSYDLSQDFVMVAGGVLKISKQVVEACIQEARRTHPARAEDMKVIVDQLSHADIASLPVPQALNASVVAVERSVMQELEALDDHISLEQCIAYLSRVKALVTTGEDLGKLPQVVAKYEAKNLDEIYSTAERLVRERFAACGAPAEREPHVELRFAGSFQPGELGPTGPGGLPTKLNIPQGFSGGTEIASGEFHDSPEQQAPTTIRRKELMTLLIDAIEPIEDDGLGDFAELCDRHLDDDGKAWFAAITEEISDSSMKLYASESSDTQMTLDDCMAFIDRREEICIPADVLSDLPDEVTSVYIERQRQTVEMERKAVRAYFAPKATAGFVSASDPTDASGAFQASMEGAQVIPAILRDATGTRQIHLKKGIVDMGTIDNNSVTAEFTPEGVKVVTSPGAEAQLPNTITCKQFVDIISRTTKARKMPARLLHDGYRAVDSSGKKRMTSLRMKKSVDGVNIRVEQDLGKLKDNLSEEICIKRINKYEKWTADVSKKYLACCDAGLRGKIEQFSRETFEQMRRSVQALFVIKAPAQTSPEAATEYEEPTIDGSVLKQLFDDRNDILFGIKSRMERMDEIISKLPHAERMRIVKSAGQNGDRINAIMENLPQALTERQCIERIDSMRGSRFTGASAEPQYEELAQETDANNSVVFDHLAEQVRERFREIGPTIGSAEFVAIFQRRVSSMDSEMPDRDKPERLIDKLPETESEAVMVEVRKRGDVVDKILSNLPEKMTLAECLERINLLRDIQPTGVLTEKKYSAIREALEANSQATYDQFEDEVRKAFGAPAREASESESHPEMGTISRDELMEIIDAERQAHKPAVADKRVMAQCLGRKPEQEGPQYVALARKAQHSLVDLVKERFGNRVSVDCLQSIRQEFETNNRPVVQARTIFPKKVRSRLNACDTDFINSLECVVRASIMHGDVCRSAESMDPNEPTIETKSLADILGECLGAPSKLDKKPDPETQEYIDNIGQRRRSVVMDLYDRLPPRLTRSLCMQVHALYYGLEPVEIYNAAGKRNADSLRAERKRNYSEAERLINQAFDKLKAPEQTIPKEEFRDLTKKARGEGLGEEDKQQAFAIFRQKVPGFDAACAASNQAMKDGYDALPDPLTKAQCDEFLELLFAASDPILDYIHHLPEELRIRVQIIFKGNIASVKKAVDDYFAPAAESPVKIEPESLETLEADGPACILKSELFAIWGQEYKPPTGTVLTADGYQNPNAQAWVDTLKSTRTVQLELVDGLPTFVSVSRFERFLQEMRGACVALESVSKKAKIPAIRKLVEYYRTQLASFERRIRMRFGIVNEDQGLAVGSAIAGKCLPGSLRSTDSAGSAESSESAEAPEFRTSKIVLLQVMKQVEFNCLNSHIGIEQARIYAAADRPVQRKISAASKKTMQAVQAARLQLPKLITLEECVAYVTHHRNNMRMTQFVEGTPLPDDVASNGDAMETEMLDKILEKLPEVFEQDKKEAVNEPEGTISRDQFIEFLGEVKSFQDKLHTQEFATAYDKLDPALQKEASTVSRSKIVAINQFRANILGDRLAFSECKHCLRYSAHGFPPEDFSSKLPQPYCKVLRRIDRDMYREFERRLPNAFTKLAVVESPEKEPQGPSVATLSDEEIETLSTPQTMSKDDFRRVFAEVAVRADSVLPPASADDLTLVEKQTYVRRTNNKLEGLLAEYPDDLTEEQCREIVQKLHGITAGILQDLTTDET